MQNRAPSSIHLRLGSALLGLLYITAGVSLHAAGAAAPAQAECSSCHGDQAAKLPKSAHAELSCDTCHDSHEKYPHPAEHSQADLHRLPPGPGGRLRQRRARSGAQGRQRGRAGLRPVSRQRPRTAAAQIAGLSQRGSGHLRHVPHRGGGTIPGQRARAGHGARHHPGAPVHGLPRRTQDHQAHQRSLPGERHAYSRHLRELPWGRPAHAQIRPALGPHGELRFLLPRPGRKGRLADGGQLRELPRRAQHSAVVGSRSPPSTPRTCPRPAESAIPAPARGSPSARCTWPRAPPSRQPCNWVRQFYLLLIPVTIGLMLLHNLGDWMRKLLRTALRRAARPARGAAGRRTATANCACCPSSACNTPSWRSLS